MRAVVLAAGDGGRLHPYTRTVPKPLVELCGRTLLDYTLESLAATGVDEAVIVTGYRQGQICDAVGHLRPHGIAVRLVPNASYTLGASYSLRAARPHCGQDPFLLVMSDHLLSAPLLRRLAHAAASAPPAAAALVAADFTDRGPAYTREASRLAFARSGRVAAIGKGLPRWCALDAGAFACTAATWDAVDASPADCELGAVFSELARRGRLFAADVTGAFWYDVDTPGDLAAATALLATPGRTSSDSPMLRFSASPLRSGSGVVG